MLSCRSCCSVATATTQLLCSCFPCCLVRRQLLLLLPWCCPGIAQLLFQLLSCCFYYLVATTFSHLFINHCFCSSITPSGGEFLPSSCSDCLITALATQFPLQCYFYYPVVAWPMLLWLRWCLDIASAAQLLLSRYSVTALSSQLLLPLLSCCSVISRDAGLLLLLPVWYPVPTPIVQLLYQLLCFYSVATYPHHFHLSWAPATQLLLKCF